MKTGTHTQVPVPMTIRKEGGAVRRGGSAALLCQCLMDQNRPLVY